MGPSFPDRQIYLSPIQVKVVLLWVSTAVLAISKYHRVDKDSGTPIGQHSLVSMANKAIWQQRPPIPRYRATYEISVVLRHIDNLGQNKSLTLKQLSEKTGFLLVFSTLSRYRLVPHLTKMSFPSPFFVSFLHDCPTQSEQLPVLGSVVHEGLDGATVKLLDLENIIDKITLIIGCYYHSRKIRH